MSTRPGDPTGPSLKAYRMPPSPGPGVSDRELRGRWKTRGWRGRHLRIQVIGVFLDSVAVTLALHSSGWWFIAVAAATAIVIGNLAVYYTRRNRGDFDADWANSPY